MGRIEGSGRVEAASRLDGSGRDLDRQAAGRMFVFEVLQRVSVVQATRAERAGSQAQPRQPHADGFAAVAAALRDAVATSEPTR